MRVEYKKIEKIGIITVSGRLDASNEKELKTNFESFLAETVYFVLDCSHLEFMDSTGLGAVISMLKSVTELKGDIYIANLQMKPKLLFEITRAWKIFNVFDDTDSAISALRKEIVQEK